MAKSLSKSKSRTSQGHKISGYLLKLTHEGCDYFGHIDLISRDRLSHGPAIVASVKDMYTLHEVYRKGKTKEFLRLMDLDLVSSADSASINEIGFELAFSALRFASRFATREAAVKYRRSSGERRCEVVKASDYLRYFWECEKESETPRLVLFGQEAIGLEVQIDYPEPPGPDTYGSHNIRALYTSKQKANAAIRLRAKNYVERHYELCLRYKKQLQRG